MKTLNLNDENLYYIGGVVRDELLNKPCFDIDVTYQGSAIEYCKSLAKNGYGEILQINEPFGTARMLIDGEEIDFASTRNEVYEKKGHLPTVTEIGCELKKDVLRRDFTVNALAKSLKTGEIIDYTNGIDDLNNKILKVLHDNSFVDDPTRIVRGLKFSVRFGFTLDEYTKQLQNHYLNNVNYDMSYKRLKKELIETFNLNSQNAYEMFFEQGIYKLLGNKEITPPKYNIEKLVQNFNLEHTWLVYLGWMDLSCLPLTKDEQKIIDEYNLYKSMPVPQTDYEIYKMFNNKTLESILLYIINGGEIAKRYFEISDVTIEIDGNDLKELGILPSPKYAECFDYILLNKLENPDITKTQELTLAKKFFEL